MEGIMNATLDDVSSAARALCSGDRYQLWRQLNEEFAPVETGVEAAWEAELEQRVRDVKEDRVPLISGAESDRRIAALMQRLRTSAAPA